VVDDSTHNGYPWRNKQSRIMGAKVNRTGAAIPAFGGPKGMVSLGLVEY